MSSHFFLLLFCLCFPSLCLPLFLSASVSFFCVLPLFLSLSVSFSVHPSFSFSFFLLVFLSHLFSLLLYFSLSHSFNLNFYLSPTFTVIHFLSICLSFALIHSLLNIDLSFSVSKSPFTSLFLSLPLFLFLSPKSRL
jgi:hypothetical protein